MNCWFMASDMGGIVSQLEERYVPAVTRTGRQGVSKVPTQVVRCGQVPCVAVIKM
jgi:hypothetical protein